MAYQPPLNGGRINATISGNTAGAGALVSTGTLTLAGGNNITLSQAGNAISIVGPTGGGGGANTFGMSNLGNTSGSSGIVAGPNALLALAGGDNVTLSQSLQGQSATITVSAAQQSVQTQNMVSFGGSTGNIIVQNANNVSFGANNSVVTASASFNQSVQTQNMVSLAGSTGNIVFSNSNNVTFGGNQSTITASVSFSQSVQTQNLRQVRVSGNTAGATASISSGTMTLAGGNNITLSQAGNAVTISGRAINAVALANSQTTYTSGTANLVASGAMTIGSAAGQSFNFSVPQTSSIVGVGGVSISSAGNTISISGATGGGGGGGIALANSQTTYTSGTANLVASGAMTINSTDGQSFNLSVPQTSSIVGVGGVSISSAGNTISISGATGGGGGGGGFTRSYYNPYEGHMQVAGQQGQSMLHFQPLQAPNVAFDRIVFPVVFTGASNSTATVAVGMSAGIYSQTGSTLSLVASYSTTNIAVHSGNVNASLNNGVRMLTAPANDTLTEGHYWMAILSASIPLSGNATVSQLLASQQNSVISGYWGEANSASLQFPLGNGVFSAVMTNIPSAVAFSDLRGSASIVRRPPIYYLTYGTV